MRKSTTEPNLEAFLIRKGAVDEDLWKSIEIQSKGTTAEKIRSCMLIFQNYRNLPREADNILKKLASPTQPEDVRKAIATGLVKDDVQIPGGLYFDLLFTLINDSNRQIRDTIRPRYESFIMPMVRLTEYWQKYQANLFLTIANLAAQYQQAISKSLSRFTTTFSNIAKVLHEPEFKDFEYNWLVFLSFDKMLLIYKMHKMGKDAEIKQLLIQQSKDKEYLKHFIEEMNASAIFKPRIPIIQDAIEAYETGKHSLSVPVLLTQIEGILWDYAERQGITFGDKIPTKTGKTKELKSARLLLKETKLKDQLSQYLSQHFLTKIYTKDFRHGILHGRNISYNNEETSMRLLLFVRALLDICS
jgi:hypothetical protein